MDELLFPQVAYYTGPKLASIRDTDSTLPCTDFGFGALSAFSFDLIILLALNEAEACSNRRGPLEATLSETTPYSTLCWLCDPCDFRDSSNPKRIKRDSDDELPLANMRHKTSPDDVLYPENLDEHTTNDDAINMMNFDVSTSKRGLRFTGKFRTAVDAGSLADVLDSNTAHLHGPVLVNPVA